MLNENSNDSQLIIDQQFKITARLLWFGFAGVVTICLAVFGAYYDLKTAIQLNDRDRSNDVKIINMRLDRLEKK